MNCSIQNKLIEKKCIKGIAEEVKDVNAGVYRISKVAVNLKKNLIIIGIIAGVLLSFSDAIAEEPVWSYQTSGAVLSVASTEDMVFAGSRGGTVSAFDMNGALRWRYSTGGDVGSVAVFGDTVAAGSANSNIYVFEKDTGKLRWDSYVGEFPKVAVSDKAVVAGSYDNKLYVLDKNTRDIIWNKTEVKEIENIFSLVISKNILVVATVDWEADAKGYVHAFDIDTGKRIWKNKINGQVYTLAVSDDMIVAGSWETEPGAIFEQGKGGVYAYDRNGNKKWVFDAEEDITSIAIFGDTVAFGVGHTYDEDKVYIVEKETGNVLWEQYIRAPFLDIKSPYSVQWIALTEKSAIFGARDGKVHVYEKETGCKRWEYKTNAEVHTVTAFNGKVIAGSLDRTVYVFNEGKGGGIWCKKQMSETTLKIIEIAGIVVIITGIILLVLLFSGKLFSRKTK